MLTAQVLKNKVLVKSDKNHLLKSYAKNPNFEEVSPE
jgi:hypothetical protein